MSKEVKNNTSPEKPPSSPFQALTTRLISAAILGTLTLYFSYLSFESFVAICILAGALMVWEWGKLTNNDSALAVIIPGFAIGISIIAIMTHEIPLLISTLCAAVFLSLWATHYWWRAKWAILGLLYIGLPLLSLIYLRQDEVYGFYAIAYIFLIVWGTDTAAYFVGSTVGGKKLAPHISPNKTWSGSFGGLFAAFIISLMFSLSLAINPIILAFVGVCLSAISQIGDLSESAVKRHFGVKDSGALIPGHGGLLDRLDGVIFASIAAGLIALSRASETPGKALLIWTP